MSDSSTMKFYKRNYKMTATDGNDDIYVTKINGSDWSDVHMHINGEVNGRITVRSKEMAEQLHFMLGQMLDL